MGKRILIIQGHPDEQSFNHALHLAYKKGATRAGAEIQEIFVSQLTFNPNLRYGYRQRTDLEPCLIEAQNKIKWAEHIVLVYPVWWGSLPAILKGFFDRVFLPGFAFKKRENSLWWDKLLSGRSARVISTLDQPPWFYWLLNGSPSDKAIKRMTFDFCGIKPVRITNIGPIRLSSEKFREKWLNKIEDLGALQK
ncbi:MAG: NADPH:quinone reductase [Bdellovibrionales bacterium RIFCSPHIGHO2_01_FULL_40_29]|nr:MAG: NADPH:quinone reductase [Bdellovibrionales bacterium RIFCSPHIGHO2_01_FULL_40_29]OFZ33466.1 MAG: NADPH:quinone reductase [Bdellovibrionales bacterium RIFCSPHIGHO2_02_FULL_40_15]